jgi:anaerobic selenocysteine-containing dehydrogenase
MPLCFVGVSDPGGPSTEPTSEFIAACPCPDGLAQDGTQEGNAARVISHGGACSRGYKRRERESEPVRLLVPRATFPQ